MATKSELIAQVAALNAELIAKGRVLEALRLELSIALASRRVVDLEDLVETADGFLVHPDDPRARPARPAYVRKPHQLPAHFAAAREAAMRMGVSVKVSV
jgi:hypothetical protein